MYLIFKKEPFCCYIPVVNVRCQNWMAWKTSYAKTEKLTTHLVYPYFDIVVNFNKVIAYTAAVYVTSQVAYTAADHNEVFIVVFMTRSVNVTQRLNNM